MRRAPARSTPKRSSTSCSSAAPTSMRRDNRGRTALMIAADAGTPAWSISARARGTARAKDKEGKTALDLAADTGDARQAARAANDAILPAHSPAEILRSALMSSSEVAIHQVRHARIVAALAGAEIQHRLQQYSFRWPARRGCVPSPRYSSWWQPVQPTEPLARWRARRRSSRRRRRLAEARPLLLARSIRPAPSCRRARAGRRPGVI